MSARKLRLFSIVFATFFFMVVVLLAHEESSAKGKTDNVSGWWILTEYHDQIMRDRAIGNHSLEMPVYEAIMVYVTGDSVFSAGTELQVFATQRARGDTIRKRGFSSAMPFFYDRRKKALCVQFTNRKNQKVTFHYRRMLSHEFLSLTKNLFEPNVFWPLKQNYRAWYVKQFFAGSFRCVNDGSTLQMNDNESLTGYGKWNAFEVDDYFGPQHRKTEIDLVRFQDTTKTGSFKDYCWEWQNDTLSFAPVTQKSNGELSLGNPMRKYVRIISGK